jgi:HSF-type DNA-binding
MLIVGPFNTATSMSAAQQQDCSGSAGGNDDQRSSMVRGLTKQSLEHGTAATIDSSHLIMDRVNVLNDVSSQNPFLMMQLAEQSRFHHLLNAENFAYGFMEPRYQQLVTPPDDFARIAQQLQQQQLQLEQQQELLFQAGALAEAAAVRGVGIEMGMAAGNFGAMGLLDLSSAALSGPSVHGSRGLEPFQTGNQGNYGLSPLQYNQSDFPHQGNSDTDQQPMKRRGESFPMVLLRILGDLEAAGTSDIACFVAGGDAFLVRNPKEFEDTVLPRYFPRMGSFGSFQRQLNLYDFRRISEGPHRGAYTHPLFRRHFPILSKAMKRTKIKGCRNNLKTAPPSAEDT